MPKLMLNFSGNREELHGKLKKWCEENDRDMTKTIMSLIRKHLNNN